MQEAVVLAAPHVQGRRHLGRETQPAQGHVRQVELISLYHPSMKEKMAALGKERTELTAFLADRPEPPALRLHPRLSDLYREKIGALAEALNQPELKPQATELLRCLISEVRMVPDRAAPGFHHIELVGDLAGILALSAPDMTKPPRLQGLRSV